MFGTRSKRWERRPGPAVCTIRINVMTRSFTDRAFQGMGIQGEPAILANPQSKGTRHILIISDVVWKGVEYLEDTRTPRFRSLGAGNNGRNRGTGAICWVRTSSSRVRVKKFRGTSVNHSRGELQNIGKRKRIFDSPWLDAILRVSRKRQIGRSDFTKPHDSG